MTVNELMNKRRNMLWEIQLLIGGQQMPCDETLDAIQGILDDGRDCMDLYELEDYAVAEDDE